MAASPQQDHRVQKSPWPPLPVHKTLFLLFAFVRGEWREQETKSCHGSSSLEEITAWVKLSHHSQNYISACKDRANIILPHLPNTRKINLSNLKLNRNKMQALCTQWIIYIFFKKIILWGLLLHSAWISDNPNKTLALSFIFLTAIHCSHVDFPWCLILATTKFCLDRLVQKDCSSCKHTFIPTRRKFSLQTRSYVINYLANAISQSSHLRILNYPARSQKGLCLR